MSTFRERLEEALRLRDITPADLSKISRVNEGAISQYRKGAYKASQRSIEKLSIALNVSIPWLMGADVPVESTPKNTPKLPSNVIPMPKMKEWKVLGATACGTPLHRETDETILAPADIKADVVFRCVGDSMINARIFDGDAVFIHHQPEVENGQIAVVRIGDEYTLKRVYVHEDYVELRAENPTVKATIVRGADLNPENFEIVGLAVAFLSTLV